MRKHISILCLLAVAYSNVTAQVGSLFDHLAEGDGILKVTLETDLTALIEDRKSEERIPAVFTFVDEDGKKQEHRLKVRSRGKFRRKVCQFPPVMLDFSKKRLKEMGYVGEYDKLKLVTHCLDDKNMGNENVVKEYLIYQMFNLLTENSYRTRLVKITYSDTEGLVNRIKRYGVLIEDTDEMALRLGGIECDDCRGLSTAQMEGQTGLLVSVFQYLIGNEDWTTELLRNVKIVQRPDSTTIAVPYDFDFSGLVDAVYALPSSDYGLLDVKQRAFIGAPMGEDSLRQVLQQFLNKKAAIYQLFEDNKLLSRGTRQVSLLYLDSFYDAITPAMEGTGPWPSRLAERAIRDYERGAQPTAVKE